MAEDFTNKKQVTELIVASTERLFKQYQNSFGYVSASSTVKRHKLKKACQLRCLILDLLRLIKEDTLDLSSDSIEYLGRLVHDK